MKQTLMTTLLFGIYIILDFLVCGYIMSFGLTLLNQPSTISVVSGLLVSLVGFIMFVYIGTYSYNKFFVENEQTVVEQPKTEENNLTNKTEGVSKDGN